MVCELWIFDWNCLIMWCENSGDVRITVNYWVGENLCKFTVEYKCYLEMFGKTSCIFDVYFMRYEFLIETAMFRFIALVIILICFKDLLEETL